MPMRSEMQRWLQQLRKRWLGLAQGALWLGGILGGFLLPPPVGISAGQEKIWLRLGQFIVGVILGVAVLGGRRWNRPRHALAWGGAAVLFLAAAVAVFFRYQQLTLGWTARYVGNPVVIGSVLTPQGRSYVETNPSLSYDDVVFDFAGHTEEIWTRDSINRRRLILAATYVACLPLFTICLIAVVQAVQCADRRPARRRATR